MNKLTEQMSETTRDEEPYREARKHVAKMISQSQEMLHDAHLHLTNFQKMKNLMRMIQMRHVRSAFEEWCGFCSAEAAEMRAKWQQPAVQKFLRGILQQSGTGAFYAWREEAGGMVVVSYPRTHVFQPLSLSLSHLFMYRYTGLSEISGRDGSKSF